MLTLDGPSMRTKHLGLDDPTPSKASDQLAIISGIEAPEFSGTHKGKRGDIVFDFRLVVSDTREDGLPNLQGPFAQGSRAGRFIYIDVSAYAGQKESGRAG